MYDGVCWFSYLFTSTTGPFIPTFVLNPTILSTNDGKYSLGKFQVKGEFFLKTSRRHCICLSSFDGNLVLSWEKYIAQVHSTMTAATRKPVVYRSRLCLSHICSTARIPAHRKCQRQRKKNISYNAIEGKTQTILPMTDTLKLCTSLTELRKI